MNRVQPSVANLRKRKMLLILPLLVVPFVTLLFWAMGGGKEEDGVDEKGSGGLNPALPNAALKDEKGLDKLRFYDLAQKDSIKVAERLKGDLFWKGGDTGRAVPPSVEEVTASTAEKYRQSSGLRTTPYGGSKERPEDQLLDKLAQLQKGLEGSAETPAKRANTKPFMSNDPGVFAGQVDRLEGLMASMNSGPSEDPEMAQLQSTLEKLLDVQHPERVRERLEEQSSKHKRVVFAVDKSVPVASVSLLDTAQPKASTVRFHSWKEEVKETAGTGIEAVVHGQQTLVDGAVIKFRLLSDSYINGTLVPKQSFVFGISSLRGERLDVAISSIKHGTSVFPVNLEVMDLDGLPGIFIPGAITRDVAKASASGAVGTIDIGALNPSPKAQAVNLGVGTARSLLQKKTKLVKVSVKGGYRVLLQNKEKL